MHEEIDSSHVEGLALKWNAGLSRRDPRDLAVARRRALGLPDDAGPVEFGRALNGAPLSPQMIARCEMEYRAMLIGRPASAMEDDVVSVWMRTLRDREVRWSREWWQADRMRWSYLDAVASGELPAPVVDSAPSEQSVMSRARRWLYTKRR